MLLLINYFLPAFYFLLIGWLLFKNRWLRAQGLTPLMIVGFYVAKICIGSFYTYVMVHLIPKADDIDLLFGGGLEIYKAFLNSPLQFPGYLAQMFAIDDFRLGNTDSGFIRAVFDGIKFIHFLLNLLSGGNLYTNVLLFNGLSSFLFLRAWAYLKLLTGSWAVGFFVFAFPAAFFFTSVILKEGIELCLIAAMIPTIYGIKNHGITILRVLALVLLFLMMFFFKYLIAVSFLGIFLMLWVFKKFPAKPLLVSASIIIIVCFTFFNLKYVHHALNLPQYIIERRLEFQELEANSRLTMRPLEPNFFSFVKAIPEAIRNVFLRPLPGEGGKKVYLIFSIELIGWWILLLILLIKGRRQPFQNIPLFSWSLLWFGIANLLIIGYTITNIGAIIRYRSVFMPLLLLFVWYGWQGSTLIHIQINNIKKLLLRTGNKW